ncbi:MAG: GTPase HflX [Candidatus Thorarchaeota archaeon]
MADDRALLIQRRSHDKPDLMDEFVALASTAGYSVEKSYDIVSPPSAKFAIRSGKVEEIATWIEINSPDVVYFSPRLTSGQVFRLMERWDVEVRDRTQLILEIFDRHARTPQAKLQIEQARLRYELPFERHQIRMRLQKEHTGDRPIAEQICAGEDLLNLRIHQIRKRIAVIQDKLDSISRSQALKKRKRTKKGFLEVTLAGYTNAGKSTLHRALTGSEVEVADQLFTTLATKSTKLPIEGRQAVLTDSVGFISDLPRPLFQAFNTTLMEIGDADVIILVVDGSDPLSEMQRKLETCLDTFNEIGANGISAVVALNKVDLLEKERIRDCLEVINGESLVGIPVSAMESTNLDELLQTVDSHLPPLTRYLVTLPYDDSSMSLISRLHDMTTVRNQDFKEGNVEVEVVLSTELAQRLERELPVGSLRRLE